VLEDENALTALQPLASDRAFQKRFAASRYVNKLALADLIRRELEIRVDPNALFDVHIKRIHEYKRQLLNILEAVALYNAIRARPMDDWTPRVKIFAGKAAASYYQAKLVIKLIHDVAKVVNNDPTVRNILKIVFLPNYSVSLAEMVIPASPRSWSRRSAAPCSTMRWRSRSLPRSRTTRRCRATSPRCAAPTRWRWGA